MKKHGFIFLLIILAAVCQADRFGTAVTKGGKAKISFRILDDEQRPVEKARVQAGFYYDPRKQGIITGETDTNGLCAIEGITHMDMWYSMEKSGYYETEGRCLFGQVEPPVINNCWQPWNPTNTVVLKPIKHPVPMYVKSVRTEIPVENKPVGFDLEKGDWVAPHGNGIHGDILFKLYRDLKSWQDYRSSLTIAFPNKGDGIQNIYVTHEGGPKLAMPYSASQDGYTTNLFFEESNGNYQEEREDQNYVFRVRTVLDENGKVVSALYGKIHGNILFDVRGSETASLLFTYYLNPTSNDRNIEFDPEKNLFGGDNRFAP